MECVTEEPVKVSLESLSLPLHLPLKIKCVFMNHVFLVGEGDCFNDAQVFCERNVIK